MLPCSWVSQLSASAKIASCWLLDTNLSKFCACHLSARPYHAAHTATFMTLPAIARQSLDVSFTSLIDRGRKISSANLSSVGVSKRVTNKPSISSTGPRQRLAQATAATRSTHTRLAARLRVVVKVLQQKANVFRKASLAGRVLHQKLQVGLSGGTQIHSL